VKKTLLLLTTATTMIFASNGAELVKANCASCHMLTTPTPDMIPTLSAPAMDAVVFHINLAIAKKKDAESFIVDYVQNPNVSKTVCESNKVAKFGVMPSLKGKVSEEDLKSIASHVMENFPSPEFVKMITEVQRNDKLNGLLNSPFLINKESLPHMTKILLQNWDKATLGLSAEQKEKLLVVRKNTMSAVREIKKQLAPLEAAIIEAVVDGEDPKSVSAKVDEVAKLKAQATRVHLKCIVDTVEILNDEQMETLFPFFDA
jgi:mono/diheme cytochrome c family protein